MTDRSYLIDTTGTIHYRHSDCADVTEIDGDATRDGAIRGLVEHGEGLCPDCIDVDARQSLLEAAGEYVL
jgi:hypothetical protein